MARGVSRPSHPREDNFQAAGSIAIPANQFLTILIQFKNPMHNALRFMPRLCPFLPPAKTNKMSSNGDWRFKIMGNFIQTNIAKSAVRELAVPIEDVATFSALVQDILTNNPFSCTAYEVSGVAQPPMAKSREAYTARILYEDEEARTIGYVTARAGTVAGFNAAKTAILADTALTTAIGGDAINSADDERYSATLRCHDANGETYSVSFSRSQITVSSYSDDLILTRIETWADTKPVLG